jgi:CHAT domain-containing protein
MAYEAAAAQHQAALAGAYPELEAPFAQLGRVRAELARRALSDPIRGETPSQHERRLRELEEEREQLERHLATQVPEIELQRRLRAADRAAIARALPAGGMLVEYLRFQPYPFEAAREERRWEPERYLAFTMPAGEPERVRMIDLGAAGTIDGLIARFRWMIAGEELPHDMAASALVAAPEDPCRGLYSRLFVPLLELTVNGNGHHSTPHFVIAPDGELCRLPFEALLSPEGRFVIEDHLISYVTVRRDVVRFGDQPVASSGAVIVADPDYDLGAALTGTEASAALWDSTGDAPTAVAGVGRGVGEQRHTNSLRHLQAEAKGFGPLSGTRAEGEAVQRLLREGGIDVASFWMKEQALEGRFKAVHRPVILHLATHGFFLPDSNRAAREQLPELWGTRRDGMGALAQALGGQRYVESPLVRSGLVFAGVNTVLAQKPVPEEVEDGFVNGMDVLTMDLLGTELMTLSACDTGMGDSRRGEGVMGLRRACTLAGARTLVMSLWGVPDDETQRLMTRFYTHLLAGMGKAAALCQAQLDLIKHLRVSRGDADPYFWAAFICQGDPAPLQVGASPLVDSAP